MENLISNFANQFDDTELECFTLDTRFRELDEWSSIIGLAIMNMVLKKYGVKITPVELRSINTIGELKLFIEQRMQ